MLQDMTMQDATIRTGKPAIGRRKGLASGVARRTQPAAFIRQSAGSQVRDS